MISSIVSGTYMFLPFLILLASCFGSTIPARNDDHNPSSQLPIARTRQATYVGKEDTHYGVDIWAGIRYSNPPTGVLRLQPPQPYEAQGTINSQSFGNPCFAVSSTANVSEDCLTLNICVPHSGSNQHYRKRNSDGLPVMFWIHGGGFNQGSGIIYGGQSLVNRSVELRSPVIVVTINYRLSFFGFSAGTEAIANNALNLGLLDQRLAMKWVHENIAAFGGDPDKFTIFGQSAGATSVGLQMTAYDGRQESLFRAAILESGSPADTLPTPPANWPAYQQAWDAVIAGIGCSNSTNVFKCVQDAPAQLLFGVINKVATLAPLPSSAWPWQPVVDGTFVADFPTKLTAAAKFAKIPMIMGFTTDEVTYVIPKTLNISSDTAILQLAGFVLPFVPLPVIQEIIALDPLSTYPDTGSGGVDWKRTTEIASNLFERCPGREWIRNVTKFAPTWKYRFNAINPIQLAQAPWENIVHSAELSYIWGPSLASFDQSADVSLSRIAQQAWISFAAHLDPNALGPLSPGASWPRYFEDSEQVLVFQKTDGSGEQANGTVGTPVGQGLHVEKDPDDRPVCDYFISQDAAFVH